jgi:hypothetical protein
VAAELRRRGLTAARNRRWEVGRVARWWENGITIARGSVDGADFVGKGIGSWVVGWIGGLVWYPNTKHECFQNDNCKLSLLSTLYNPHFPNLNI